MNMKNRASRILSAVVWLPLFTTVSSAQAQTMAFEEYGGVKE